LPHSAAIRHGDNPGDDPLLVDASARAQHTFAVEMRIERPAPTQRVSLPVWIPGSYLVREFARHLSALTAEQAGRPVPVEQVDKASWIVHAANDAELVLRYRVYAFDVSVRAAFLDADRGFFNGTSVCLRVDGREGEAHALALAGLARAGTSRRRSRPPPRARRMRSSPRTTTSSSTIRSSSVAAGAVASSPPASSTNSSSPARCPISTARRCSPTPAHLRDGDRVLARSDGKPPFQRYLFLLNAVDEGRGGLEHRASTALVAPRRHLPRSPTARRRRRRHRGNAAAATERGLHRPARPDLARVLPRLERQAPEAARLRPPRLHARELHEAALVLRRLHLVLRRPAAAARRAHRRGAYLQLVAKTMSAVAGDAGAHAAERRRRELRRLGEVLPRRREHAERDDQLLRQGRARRARPRPRVARRGPRQPRRGDAAAVVAERRGAIDEGDIAAALEAVGGRSFTPELAAWVHGTGELPLDELLPKVGVAVERQPATLAQRLGVRVSESALTGVKVTHVLRGGAAERIGLAAGDELIGVGGWRLRRLDDALRFVAPGGETPLVVSRDQRLLELRFDGDALADDDRGAVQLRRADAASAEAKRLCEAWICG
jgi:hypothetical protein